MTALQKILYTSLKACEYLQPLISTLYYSQNNTAVLKQDMSVLTLADGIVQNIILDILFKNKFANKIGEEYESNINLLILPYFVNDIPIAMEFISLIDQVKSEISSLSLELSDVDCTGINLFLDPIDGTREFATQKGEQSSICIGFSDNHTGKSIAGIIYRPLTSPPTWAMGAPQESFMKNNLHCESSSTDASTKGFLTTNGEISLFTQQLINELKMSRVSSGGAGNKLLMLLENKGQCYIQDRGVSRWDTCAGEAILRAHGGVISKLTAAVATSKNIPTSYEKDYLYLPTNYNLDLDEFSEISCSGISSDKVPATAVIGTSRAITPYANLCGLFALNAEEAGNIEEYHRCIRLAAALHPPKYA